MGVCELIGSKRWASVRHPLTVCNTDAELVIEKVFTCFGLRLTESLDLRLAVLVLAVDCFRSDLMLDVLP